MSNTTEHGLLKTVYTPSTVAKARVILAHGAGAGNRHEFMTQFAALLAEKDIEVHSINFPYMQQAYELDKKRPPNSNKQLVNYFRQLVLDMPDDLPLLMIGKSMGGRVATQIAVDTDIANRVTGVVVLGYPFMPPGKPEKLVDRVSHFVDIQTKVLILQGERDNFGGKELVTKQELPQQIKVSWIPSGDHSFKPLKSSGYTQAQNIELSAELTNRFIDELVR
ncbi:MAG: dienelactone hydrolase family protein [Gammaproteobacteria bacterium]|nr:dienelactone hydrolase family protein [Gammaproteobacteria bacterium]